MLYGMGTVFIFLTILVFATGLMSKLVNTFVTTKSPDATLAGSGGAATSSNSALSNSPPSPQVLEAITQAIALHRQR